VLLLGLLGLAPAMGFRRFGRGLLPRVADRFGPGSPGSDGQGGRGPVASGCDRARNRRFNCGNGPEMVSNALRKWVAKTGSQIQYIAPGSPWENGSCESFNRKLRDECLRQEIVNSLKEAQIVIGLWQNTYNRVRPHSSLGDRPPAPVSVPDLAFRLSMAVTMQELLSRPGPKYRSGQLAAAATKSRIRPFASGQASVARSASTASTTAVISSSVTSAVLRRLNPGGLLTTAQGYCGKTEPCTVPSSWSLGSHHRYQH